LEGNVEYVDIAIGYNKTFYFGALGGFRQDAFLNEAKRSLIANYSLKSGQSLENITFDIKTTTFGAFQRIEVIALADVVQKENKNQITYSENYLKLLSPKNPKSQNFFAINENVVTYKANLKTYRIVGFHKNKAVLFNFSKNGAFNITRRKYVDLFKKENCDEVFKQIGFTVNDSVFRLKQPTFPSEQPVSGKVLAVNRAFSIVVFAGDTIKCENDFIYKKN
jgi:hypothetical protein